MSAPSMSMNKVIHGAVRRDLRRFRAALDGFVDGDRQRAEGLGRAFSNFDTQLTEHHEGEHEVAWPVLAAVGVDRATIDRFDDEHDAMAAALADARTAMAALARSASRADAEAAAACMARLDEVATAHLDSEEQVSEPFFAEHHDHPAVVAMSRHFKRQPLRVVGPFFAWVQDGAEPPERAGLRDNVPAPVVAVITALFGRRYRREVAPVWSASTGA